MREIWTVKSEGVEFLGAQFDVDGVKNITVGDICVENTAHPNQGG
jgi:hypothetical protein